MKRIKRLFDVKCPYCKGCGGMVIYGEDGADATDCDTCYGQGKVSPIKWLREVTGNLRCYLRPSFDPFAEDEK
jgi:Zn ribbon nucleic-acid-binding protein